MRGKIDLNQLSCGILNYSGRVQNYLKIEGNLKILVPYDTKITYKGTRIV